MKLVSIHKHVFMILILIGGKTIYAQNVWSLKSCIDTAQIYNKSLQINRNNIAIGFQMEKEAKANLNPKATANVDYKYFIDLPHQLMPLSTFNPAASKGEFKDAQFGVPHNINANIQLTMPLFNPQIRGNIEKTKISSKILQLQFQKTEEQLLYDVTTLYYNAQILQHQLIFIDSNLINTNKLLKNLKLLHEYLMVKGTDVNKVQLQANQLNTQRENANNKFIQVLNALKFNMGIELERDVIVESNIDFQTGVSRKSATNVDLDIIKKQSEVLNIDLSILKKSIYLPSLNVIAFYGTTGFGYDKKPNNFLKFYPVGFAGIQLVYPLFNGTVTQRKINQKKLELSNNDLQAQLISDKNSMEIENSNREIVVAQKTVSNTENQIQLAQTIYNQTILQQKEGTASLTDVLLADNALREAQQYYLSAIVDYLKADLELKKLMGTIKN